MITPLRAALTLAAIVLGCHAPLPLTDYVTYDDTYMLNWATRGDRDSLRTMYTEVGGQIGYAYFSLFAGLGGLVTGFKVAALAFTFAAGWFAWRVGVASGMVSPREALLVAAVVVAFPAFKVRGGFAYSVYDWAPAVFLLAALLALRAEQHTGWASAWRRGLAVLLFAVSFQMPSLLMFYGGFYLLLVRVHQRAAGRRWFHVPWRFCAARPDYLLLPFAYHVGVRVLFPATGVYATYNQIAVSGKAIAAVYKGLPRFVTDPFELFATYPPAVQLVCAAIAVGVWLVARRVVRVPSESGGRPAALLAFGGLLLVFGTFPYAAVGKPMEPWGRYSSYAPLLPLSFGVLLLGVVKLLSAVGRLLAPVLAAVGVCWAAAWWHDYLTMQGLEARNRGLVRHLRADPATRDCAVYFVRNLYPIPRTTDDLFGWQWCYVEAGVAGVPRSYAYNGIPSNAAVPDWYVAKSLEETTIGYSLGGIDPRGKQAIVLVRPATRVGAARLGWRYLRVKWTRPADLPAFTEQVVRIETFAFPWDAPDVTRRAEATDPE